MPDPSKFKDKASFISACISTVMSEKKDATTEQAAGQCYGMWRQYLKNKRSKGEELTEEEAEELRNIGLKELTNIGETLKKL